MKKGLLFVAVIAASLASCKKDHTCTCTTTDGTNTGTPDVTIYPESSKAAARANCVDYSYTNNSGVTYTTTCELK